MSTGRWQPHAQNVAQIVDVVRDVIIDGEIQVPADGVEAVVAFPRAVDVENRPALVVPVAQHLEDGREVDAASAQIVIDARHAVFLLRRRGGVAAIFGVGVLEMHFGDAREIIADDLRRDLRRPAPDVRCRPSSRHIWDR